MCSSDLDGQQLAALGEVRRPSIADVFVAVMSRDQRSEIGNQPSDGGSVDRRIISGEEQKGVQ